MSLSIFNDKTHPPSKVETMEVLGKCYGTWIDLVQYFRDRVSPVTEIWKNYGESSGWTLLLRHKDRTILYLFPNKRYFTVLFVYGEKAINAAKEAELPDAVWQLITHAKPYKGERSFQVEVKGEKEIELIKTLIKIKLLHSL
ncbi:MAG: DUF3788 family protein [Bacteroidales bacterium]|nr:DUF3788 family protein [Bacteroidales bacterium]